MRGLQRRPWGDGSGPAVAGSVVHGSDQVCHAHFGVERRQLLSAGEVLDHDEHEDDGMIAGLAGELSAHADSLSN